MTDDNIPGAWWAALNTGGAARLRRCRRPLDAMLLPETLDLIRRLKWPRDRTDHAAILAIVLAHVKADDSRQIMRAVGRETFEDETALLSEVRFRRLITTEEPGELLAGLIRLVQIKDGAINIRELANVLRWWTDRARQQWAASYYAAFTPTEREETENV